MTQLLCFWLSSTSFQYNGQHYQQLDGVAMGSPVSSVIADIFMEDFEDKAFAAYSNPPRLWKRFVDDILAIVKKTEVDTLLQFLNNQHQRIQFTIEEGKDGSLPFMDVRFTRKAEGELVMEVYQKPTHTNRYVQYDSHHSKSVKSGVVKCLANRAMTVSSDKDIRDKTFKHIVRSWSAMAILNALLAK